MKKVYFLILSVALLLGAATKANAQFIQNSAWYTIQDYQGRYVTNNASATDGTKMSLTTDSSNSGIHWKFLKAGDYWIICSAAVDQTMDCGGTTPTTMSQWQKSTSSTNQNQWFLIEAVSGKVDTYMIIPYNAQGRAYYTN